MLEFDFSPATYGFSSDGLVLELETLADGSSTYVIALRGWGKGANPHTDVFAQDRKPRSTFFLTSTPDLSRAPIEVRIDDVPTPSVTPTGDVVWTFDGAANSVYFEPLYVPAHLQRISITYALACEQ